MKWSTRAPREEVSSMARPRPGGGVLSNADFLKEIDSLILKWERQRGHMADIDRLRSLCIDVIIAWTREVLNSVQDQEGPGEVT